MLLGMRRAINGTTTKALTRHKIALLLTHLIDIVSRTAGLSQQKTFFILYSRLN